MSTLKAFKNSVDIVARRIDFFLKIFGFPPQSRSHLESLWSFLKSPVFINQQVFADVSQKMEMAYEVGGLRKNFLHCIDNPFAHIVYKSSWLTVLLFDPAKERDEFFFLF